MFSRKTGKNKKTIFALILLLILIGAAAGVWYWQQYMADKMIQATIAAIKQDRPNINIAYANVRANAFTKSIVFDDFTVNNGNNTSLRIKELSIQKLELDQDSVTHANVTMQNLGLHSGNRNFAGDIKFEFFGNEEKTDYRVDNFFFEDLASKSTVKWQSAAVSNIVRDENGITNFNFAAQDIRLHVVESDGMAHDPKPIAVKFSFDKTKDGLNHVRQFAITENTGKFLFGIEHLATQLADKNFAFLVEKIKIPAEFNPLAGFGYGEFSLNLATSGTMMPDAYQLRQEIALQDGFHFRIMINLDPSILDLTALDENTNYMQKIRGLMIEYRDLSLLQRVYAQMGAEQMKISGQQMVMGMAASYGLDKDPNFTSSLNALQNFMASPGNIRMTIQPQPALDMSNTMGLAMTNPAELARQLQLQFTSF